MKTFINSLFLGLIFAVVAVVALGETDLDLSQFTATSPISSVQAGESGEFNKVPLPDFQPQANQRMQPQTRQRILYNPSDLGIYSTYGALKAAGNGGHLTSLSAPINCERLIPLHQAADSRLLGYQVNAGNIANHVPGTSGMLRGYGIVDCISLKVYLMEKMQQQ